MPVQTQLQQRRGTAASWTSTNPTLAAGEIGFETDTGKFKIGNGSTAWAALAYSAGATAVTYLFNATSGQTTFSGADANGLTLAYTVGAEQVYLNGVLQVRGSDYTATNGTSIVLTSGALTSDVLNVIAYSAMTITDTYTQAQADAKFVQQTNNFFAGKNKIINGDFNINQRNFTSGNADNSYNFDRWQSNSSGGTVTTTANTFTLGTAPVAGYEGKNFFTVATSGQTTSAQLTLVSQKIESVRTFANQTVTVSFWAKANTGTPKIAVELQQNFGTGGSPSATLNTYGGQATLSTSWARYSVSVAVPTISTKTIGTNNNDFLSLILWYSAGSDYNARTGSLGLQNATIDLWGVQLEAGSIATPFQTATGTLAGELAACQRYYFRQTGGSPASPLAAGYGDSTTRGVFPLRMPVTMRVEPNAIEYSGVGINFYGAGQISVTSLTLDTTHAGPDCVLLVAGVASGLVQYRPYDICTGSTGYVGLSAEL